MAEFSIKDGDSGDIARVENKHLATTAIIVSEFEHASEEDGDGFIWASDAVNEAANGTVLLVKNTDSGQLHITSVRVSTDTATEVTVHLPTVEVTPTGGAVTGVKANTGKIGDAEATAKTSESDNTQGNVIGTVFLAANASHEFNFEGVVLAKNKSIGVDLVANVTLASCEILGHY